MTALAAVRTKELPITPNAVIPPCLRVEIRLSAPAGATPDDVSRLLTSALVGIAEDYGVEYAQRQIGA